MRSRESEVICPRMILSNRASQCSLERARGEISPKEARGESNPKRVRVEGHRARARSQLGIAEAIGRRRSLATATGRFFGTIVIAVSSLGCDLLVPDPVQLVQVFTTHYALDEEGAAIPGGEAGFREFTTNRGWTVSLQDAYVTTADVTLVNCANQVALIGLSRGLVAEDLNSPDLEPITVGSLEMGPTSLCAVTVHYAPFVADESSMTPRSAEVEGASVLLTGLAEKNGMGIPFNFKISREFEVEVEFIDEIGQIINITGDEPFPLEITLGKTYHEFFEGVDFSSYDEATVKNQIVDILGEVTHVHRIEP